jgi:hypothetical protein
MMHRLSNSFSASQTQYLHRCHPQPQPYHTSSRVPSNHSHNLSSSPSVTNTPLRSSYHEARPSGHSLHSLETMVKSDTIFHIIEIVGIFVWAHHLWPKGITYGEMEEWERKLRKRSSTEANGVNGSNGRRRESTRQETRLDDRPSRGDAGSRRYSRRAERYDRNGGYDEICRSSRQYERA